jgi:hypothetical protein
VTTVLRRDSLPVLVLDGIVEVNSKGSWRCVDPVTGRLPARLPAVVAADGRTAYVHMNDAGSPRSVGRAGSALPREALNEPTRGKAR